LPLARRLNTDFPDLDPLSADAPGGTLPTLRVIAAALFDLYNPAQIDVLFRVSHAVGSLSPAVQLPAAFTAPPSSMPRSP